MHDLTKAGLAHLLIEERQDSDPDLLAGLLASLLRAEAVRRGPAFSHVALFAYALRNTYAPHSSHASAHAIRTSLASVGHTINRSLEHLVREYAAACGLPSSEIDDALVLSARIWHILHPLQAEQHM